MVASNIKVFLRVRPSATPSKSFSSKPEEGVVSFDLEKHLREGEVNNTKTNYKFRFDGILSMKVSQEEVFNIVAKPVIEDVLQGINGTIFAYGQTGSGKTFTITGGAERYSDRGIIPRTIAYLFDAFKQRNDATFRLYISYLEIYNNEGYDLLSRDDTAQKLEDLPKVILREDDEKNIHLRNLSVNVAQKAEDALNLLFLGDTNRVVAETPMNDASTRSHCMFILWVDSTKPDSDTVRRAKLHLVDLAGSERISKTGVEGNLQKEARYINLSLFYLEQVIVALHDKAQGKGSHVPYRNSMMTSVLRDSLGGNCKTVMVGAMAVEDRNIDESISTCSFAQRVASIKNNAMVNEELDPALLIKRLKKEASELRDELKFLSNNGDVEEELNEQGVQECQKLVDSYLAETDPEAPFVCGSVRRFQECFRVLREVYWQRRPEGALGQGLPAVCHASPSSEAGNALRSLEVKVVNLRQEVAVRDEEIGLLVNQLGKRGGKAQSAVKDGRVFIKANPAGADSGAPKADRSPPAQAAASCSPDTGAPAGGSSKSAPAAPRSAPADPALLLDRNKAFEVFRKSVRRAEVAEEGREAGKKLVAEAASLGERANAVRNVIQQKQSRIEKLHMERFMESSPRDPEIGPALDTPEIVELQREIEEQKAIYHQCTARLKQARLELENCKKSAALNRERLQRDFEAWYLALQASSGVDVAAYSAPAGTAPEAVAAAAPAPVATPAAGTTRPPRRGSSSPQASEADSSARPSPAFGASQPAPTMMRPRVTPEEQPVRAWAAPTQSSLLSEASSSCGSCRRDAERAPSAASAASTAASAPRPLPTPGAPKPKLTGHADTDDEIAKFYAAMADLES